MTQLKITEDFWDNTEKNAKWVDSLPQWKKGSPVNYRLPESSLEDEKENDKDDQKRNLS